MSEKSSPPKITMDVPFTLSFAAPELLVTGGLATTNPPTTNSPAASNDRSTAHATTITGSGSDNAPQAANPTQPPATPPSTGKGKGTKAKADLIADVTAILADYDNILSRIEAENAAIRAAARRIATSRKNMTRAFDDVAKSRQRMAAVFEKARAASTTVYPSPAPNSPHGGTGSDNHAARGHKRTPSELSRMDLERRRWDVMTRYEELYRERKEVDAEVACLEETRGKDAEWVQGMFFRVAEKGLFEAAVVREKKRTPVVPDDEDDDEEGEGEEVEY